MAGAVATRAMRLPVAMPLGPNVLADRSRRGSGRSALVSASNGRCAAGEMCVILSHAVAVLEDVTMSASMTLDRPDPGHLDWLGSHDIEHTDPAADTDIRPAWSRPQTRRWFGSG